MAAHMVADVPVASFLSGGLDSSLVTAMAANRDPSIEAYTITFRPEDQKLEAMPDDATYARKMAAHLGIRLHEIEISPDVVDLLPRVVDVLDEPIGDPAAINTVLMCQAARDAGVKVLLSGMGADELFGGYRRHLACLLGARYQKLPRGCGTEWWRRAWAGSRSPRAVGVCATAAGPSGSSASPSCRRRRPTAAATASTTRRSWPTCSTRRSVRCVDDVVDAHHRLYTDTELTDHVNRMCLTDSRFFLSGLNLAYTDRSSMSASTEVRVPFVDTEVFRAAFTFRAARRSRAGPRRSRCGRSPRAGCRPTCSTAQGLVRRPAAGLGHQRPRAADRRRPARRRAGGVGVPAPAVGAADGAEQRTGRTDQSKQLWQLLSMELWYRGARAAGVAAP